LGKGEMLKNPFFTTHYRAKKRIYFIGGLVKTVKKCAPIEYNDQNKASKVYIPYMPFLCAPQHMEV